MNLQTAPENGLHSCPNCITGRFPGSLLGRLPGTDGLGLHHLDEIDVIRAEFSKVGKSDLPGFCNASPGSLVTKIVSWM